MVLIEGSDPQGVERVVDRPIFMASLHRHRKMDLVLPDVNRFDLCDDAMVPTLVVEAWFGTLGRSRTSEIVPMLSGYADNSTCRQVVHGPAN